MQGHPFYLISFYNVRVQCRRVLQPGVGRANQGVQQQFINGKWCFNIRGSYPGSWFTVARLHTWRNYYWMTYTRGWGLWGFSSARGKLKRSKFLGTILSKSDHNIQYSISFRASGCKQNNIIANESSLATQTSQKHSLLLWFHLQHTGCWAASRSYQWTEETLIFLTKIPASSSSLLTPVSLLHHGRVRFTY